MFGDAAGQSSKEASATVCSQNAADMPCLGCTAWQLAWTLAPLQAKGAGWKDGDGANEAS